MFPVVWLWNNVNLSVFPEVQPKPFNSPEWKAWSVEDMHADEIRVAYSRRDMLEDLLSKYNFVGWTTAQLTNLLGSSDSKFCPQEWDVAYPLGTDFVDYVALVFRLGPKGKVESYTVVIF